MQPLPHHLRATASLARGDALAALNSIAGDDSAHALALRGIALAHLQELEAAQRELQAAAAAFRDEPLYRARALAALAEVAAARREIGTALSALGDAADRLEKMGDPRNAAWARLVRVRILVLVGSLAEAREEMESIAADLNLEDPVLRATHELVRAAVSVREMAAGDALETLNAALAELSYRGSSKSEPHPLVAAELRAHRSAFAEPLARLSVSGQTTELSLPDLATVFRGGKDRPPLLRSRRNWLVIDAIAGRVGYSGEDFEDLSARVVPFSLLVELARDWPEALASDELIARVFEGPPEDESYRERCRVEIGRLRRLLPATCKVVASGHAWRLVVARGETVALVELLTESTSITALLADGQPWAARDLALAIGASQRSVQRALRGLACSGAVQAVGQARSQRWVSTVGSTGIATQMFLVSLLAPVKTWDSPKPKRRSS